MNKQELIQKLDDIEWDDFDFYNHKITFPTTTNTTTTTAKTTTYTTANIIKGGD